MYNFDKKKFMIEVSITAAQVITLKVSRCI